MRYNDCPILMANLRRHMQEQHGTLSTIAVCDGVVMAGVMGAVARFADTNAADAALTEAGWVRVGPLDLSVLTIHYRAS